MMTRTMMKMTMSTTMTLIMQLGSSVSNSRLEIKAAQKM